MEKKETPQRNLRRFFVVGREPEKVTFRFAKRNASFNFSGTFRFADYIYIEENSIWNKIAIKVADVLVIGVVLGFITNAAHFIGFFKQDLQDIIGIIGNKSASWKSQVKGTMPNGTDFYRINGYEIRNEDGTKK